MAVAMIGPKFYAWDKNGKPLAFGKLYTYQARTNVPKATYQSEDQVVENTNPVILNGEGYGNIYLSGSYKMVLKDDDENEIWSSDPVSSAQATEWSNCQSATYLSPNSFKVGGNFTALYEQGRVVRIDNDTTEYSYSTIESAVFASGETTVTVIDSVVATGVLEVCTSIVGPNSRPTNTVLNFKTLIGGTNAAVDSTLIKEGDTINVKERTEGGGGSAVWDVVLASSVSPNARYIVQCIGLTDLALVIRSNIEVNAEAIGVENFNELINLSSNFDKVVGSGDYEVTTETIDLTGKSIDIDISKGRVFRNSDETLTLSTPGKLHLVMGTLEDTLNLTSRMIEVFNGTDLLITYANGISNGTPFYASNVNGVRMINIKSFKGFTYQGGNPFELKSCSNVVVDNVHYSECLTGPKLEIIGSDEADTLQVTNLTAKDTGDTALFMRLVALAGKFKLVNVSNIIMDKIGKAGVKFTAPSTATGLEIQKCVMSNIVVTGYGLLVASPAIAVFRSAADTGIDLRDVAISNCVVDGISVDGTQSALTGDMGGVSVRYARNVTLNGIVATNCVHYGINIAGSERVSGAGNVVSNCGLTGTSDKSKSGVSLEIVKQGCLQIDSYNNVGSGIYLEKVREMRISGTMNDNALYAIQTVNNGLAEEQTMNNAYSITGLRNTLGFASYEERVENNSSSREISCFDGDGSRDVGTTTRRDDMTSEWNSSMFIGRTFYNTTTSALQVYTTGGTWADV